jgi:hypothetical protein
MTTTENKPRSVTFDSTLQATGNNTGIVVPAELIDKLDAGKRPPVVVVVNGYEYRNTVAVMGGKYMISVSAAIRKATGLSGGDPIKVTLTIADSPRSVDMPADFAVALNKPAATRSFFDSLSNSLQRYHVDNINNAKTAETRQRRIDKATDLFRAGKQR